MTLRTGLLIVASWLGAALSYLGPHAPLTFVAGLLTGVSLLGLLLVLREAHE